MTPTELAARFALAEAALPDVTDAVDTALDMTNHLPECIEDVFVSEGRKAVYVILGCCGSYLRLTEEAGEVEGGAQEAMHLH